MKFIIVIIILALFVIGIIVVLYFLYEKPMQKEVEVELIDFNVYSYDLVDTEYVSTGFLIFKDNVLFYNYSTAEGGSILVQVPVNHSYSIRNYNLDE
jgi:hypothetical protein